MTTTRNHNLITFGTIAAIGILFLVSIQNMAFAVRQLIKPPSTSVEQMQDPALKAFARVDSALQTKPMTDAYEFTGSFTSPIRTMSGVTHKSPDDRARVKVHYKNLFLKGTLIKDNALAIIEDADGKTYICKQGDRIENRIITSIGDNIVTIKDENGTTTLSVKEK